MRAYRKRKGRIDDPMTDRRFRATVSCGGLRQTAAPSLGLELASAEPVRLSDKLPGKRRDLIAAETVGRSGSVGASRGRRS